MKDIFPGMEHTREKETNSLVVRDRVKETNERWERNGPVIRWLCTRL